MALDASTNQLEADGDKQQYELGFTNLAQSWL